MSKAFLLSPQWKRMALPGTLAVLGLAMPATAQASALATPLTLAVTGMLTSNCSRHDTFAPASSGIVAERPQSKSEAILGGTMSALERIRAEQAGLQMPQPTIAASAPSALPDVALAMRCPEMGLAIPVPARPALPDITSAQPAADNFLASSRVAIRQTAFSDKWQRVSGARLARSEVTSIIGLSPRSAATRIQFVNRWVNRSITYGEDREIWGARDYWATAEETLDLRRGDCEDLAILKYQMLLAMGVNQQDMYLTLARDLARNADHAVLVVRLGNRFFMLDNSTDAILPANLSYDYRPTLSFNSESAWLHGRVARPLPQIAYRSVSAMPSPRVIGFSR